MLGPTKSSPTLARSRAPLTREFVGFLLVLAAGMYAVVALALYAY
jgi:hypothetical protein